MSRRVGSVPPVSTTGALPVSRPPPVTDADVFNTVESDQESLGDSAAASDHMCVDGDDDGNAPGDASPSKRARTASSSSYAEFISGTAASKECDSLERHHPRACSLDIA